MTNIATENSRDEGAEVLRVVQNADAGVGPSGCDLLLGFWFSEDKLGRIWDANTGQDIVTFTGHQDGVWDIELSPDGTRLATSSLDGTAKIKMTIESI